eukprot:15454833-Alexandrium_andersonii.AAC.1
MPERLTAHAAHELGAAYPGGAVANDLLAATSIQMTSRLVVHRSTPPTRPWTSSWSDCWISEPQDSMPWVGT